MDIIFDLDGTLADCQHRIHLVRDKPKNHREFFKQCINDTLITDVARLSWNLSIMYSIYLVSGRSDECRKETEEWLVKNHISRHYKALYMRKQGDYRDDSIVKQEILNEYWPGERKKDIFAIFDDRDRVVAMWRANGLRCYQVASGDF